MSRVPHIKSQRLATDREWTTNGSKITDPVNLAAIEKTLDEQGPIIVQHFHYYGGCSMDWRLFHDYDKFVDYLEEHAKAGDLIGVWDLLGICEAANALVLSKCPDEHGEIPIGGAY